MRRKSKFVLTTCFDREDKKNHLSNIKGQCDENGSFDTLARPDLNVVHVLVSPEGSKSSISDETEEGCELNTGTGSPDAIEDCVSYIGKPIDKEGKGSEGEERKDERFSWGK